MDLKRYKKTRYQNIYKNIKNGNYLVVIPSTKKVVSKIENKKIFDISDALNIRDNKKIKMQKKIEISNTNDFDALWDKYITNCEKIEKQAYNTILRKNKDYNKYFKESFKIKISKITKYDIITYLENLTCSLKQKNELLKQLKAFFNWCVKEEHLVISPAANINMYKVPKTEMKFWTPEELKKFLTILQEEMRSSDINEVKKAYMIYILTIIGFTLGDRIGETRALTFNCFDREHGLVNIKHSINYNRKEDNYFSTTKTKGSERDVDVTDKLFTEVDKYYEFVKNNINLNIAKNDLIFFNYDRNKPYSDATLRKHFKYYLVKSGVSTIRMYDLRHTYVTTMMGEGKELYLFYQRIGHKDYKTTVNKYGHLSNKTKKEVASITDKYY